jgi:hypothetical protein
VRGGAEVTEEPRRLGALGMSLLSLGAVLAFGLVVVTAKVLADRSRLATERDVTSRAVAKLGYLVVHTDDHGYTVTPHPPTSRGGDDDRSGQRKLVAWYMKEISPRFYIPPFPPKTEVLDAWGHAILYRCPGPVHKRGWDIYSVGPDGIDDQGQGDDVLVGEDLAAVTSG